MTYLNSAVDKDFTLPVQDYHIDTPLEQYDLNFCYPVRVLESQGVRLEPLVPCLHARALYNEISEAPGSSVYRYFGAVPPQTFSEYLTQIESFWRSQPACCNFVIYDTSYKVPRIAGSISYICTSKAHMHTEIGYVMILPEFHRTHVTTHAAGLLMKYALDSPSEGGLGLRRVNWIANTSNLPSISAAKRLGYHEEGILRYHWMLKPGKEGPTPEGMPKQDHPGRHNWCGSMCWDDWNQNGKKEHVEKLMAREVVKKE